MIEYEIKTIPDFLRVYFEQTVEQRKLMLKDFLQFLIFAEAVKENKVYKMTEVFTWRNDGIEGLNEIHITLKGCKLIKIENVTTCSTCKHYTPDNNAGEFQCPIKHDEISEPDDDSCDKWEGR